MKLHLFFSLWLYVWGVFFLTAVGRFDWPVRGAMAFVAGVGVWTLGAVTCLVLRLELSVANTAFLSFLLICTLGFFRKAHIEADLERFRVRPVSCFGWILLFGVVVASVTCFSYCYNFSNLSPDSWQSVAIGGMIGKIGMYPPEYTGLLDEFTILLPIMTVSGLQLGMDFLPFTLFPMYGASLLTVLFVLTLRATRFDGRKLSSRILLSIVAAGICMSTPVFMVHSYYVNEHMLAGINFLIVIAGVNEYLQTGETRWLRLAGFCLGILTLQRSEMILFGALPFCLLLSGTQDRKTVGAYLLPFLFIAYGWELFKKLENHTAATSMLSRDSLMFQGILLLCYLGIYFGLWSGIGRKIAKRSFWILTGLLVAVLAGSVAFSGDGSLADPIKAAGELCRILFTGIDQKFCKWGWSWFLLLGLFLLDVVFLRSVHRGLRMIFVNVFLLRILLYSFPGIFPKLNHLSSGSRILMHFFPAFILYASLVVNELISYGTEDGHYASIIPTDSTGTGFQ
jgi:hypothetical protein